MPLIVACASEVNNVTDETPAKVVVLRAQMLVFLYVGNQGKRSATLAKASP